MRVFFLPNDIKGIVFDIDGTLYSNDAYAASQEEEILKRFAEERALPLEEVKAMVEGYRRDFAERNGGRRPSLGNTFLSFGVSIGVSSLWREEVLRPELFLSPDSRLAETLSILSGATGFSGTNNPTSVGRRTLKALGVSEFFPSVIGLDRSGESKPAKRPFILASEELSLQRSNFFPSGTGTRWTSRSRFPSAWGHPHRGHGGCLRSAKGLGREGDGGLTYRLIRPHV
jgi:phosphoglycolate phosphatase/putative hydrolase of the HAD superfamily